MSCCGSKKDVNKNAATSAVRPVDTRHHKEVRASKVFGTDDTVQSSVITKGFAPIR